MNISSIVAQGAFKCSDMTVVYTDANTYSVDTHMNKKHMLGSQNSIFKPVITKDFQHM